MYDGSINSIMNSLPNSYDRLVAVSEERTDLLVNDLLHIIDPNTITPFSDPSMRAAITSGPPRAFLSSGPPVTSTAQSNFVRGGTFERNEINIAPLVMNDVEMM